jgi:hypothetical protein
VLGAVVTAHIGTTTSGAAGLLVSAITTGDTVDLFSCGPLEYAASTTADILCDWAYSYAHTDVSNGKQCAAMFLYDCNTNALYNDAVRLANIATWLANSMAIVVDDVYHITSLSNAETGAISTIGELIDLFNARFGAYVTMTASGNDSGLSGLRITSTQNTVTKLKFAPDIPLIPLSGGGVCGIVYNAESWGVPYANVVTEPILTPSPHTPPFVETYIPMRTYINSDIPSVSAPYWLVAIGDNASQSSSAFGSYGQTSTGTPGSSDLAYRQIDSTYAIGSYYNSLTSSPTVMVEVRYTDGDQAGQLITTGGYAGRVIIPISLPGAFTSYVTGVGVCVGNSTGGVYVLAGAGGSSGYGAWREYAVLMCLDPKLTTVNWIRYIDLGEQNGTDITWGMSPIGGFAINKTTNDVFVVMQNVDNAPPPDMYTPATTNSGVTVLAFDSTGNSMWNKSLYGRHNSTVNFAPLTPAHVAVHESTGNIVVGCAERVVKMSGVNGDVLWSTDIFGANMYNGQVIQDVAVDQTTGDIFVSVNQTAVVPM